MTTELTIFNYSGKTFIGNYCTFSPDEEKPSFTGIAQKIDDVYVFQAPAELSYSINVASDATAELISTVMPLYPGGFMSGSKEKVYFAFPKSDTVVSSLKSDNIHSNIVTQYKQLTGLS